MTVTFRCPEYDCPDGGLVTTDEDEMKEHLDKKHPLKCTRWKCDGLAAYKYHNGRGYYHYCAEHAAKTWPNNEFMRKRIERVTRTANEDAERLPEDHPLEQTLRESDE